MPLPVLSIICIFTPQPLKVVANSDNSALFVNVKTIDERGLTRAAEMNLAGSGLANVVNTNNIEKTSSLFENNSSRGRVFMFFSHPVRRIVHNYYKKSFDPESEDYDSTIAEISLIDYVQSDMITDNLITRYLINDFNSPNITSTDIEVAKDIIRRKIVVGIMEWLESSITRVEKYYGWFGKTMKSPKTSICHYRQIYKEAAHLLLHATPEWNSYVTQIVAERNSADMEVYEYARDIFLQQAALVKEVKH